MELCAHSNAFAVYVRACHRCVCTCERLSLIGAIVADCATCEALKRACVEFGSVHGVGWVCGVGARVSMLAVIAGVTTLTSKHTNTFVSQTTRLRCNSIFAVMHQGWKKRVQQRDRLAHCNIHGTCVSLALSLHIFLYLYVHLPVNTSRARANACAQVVPACMGSTIHGVCSKLTWFAINLHMVLWAFACKYCYCKPR